MEAQRLARICDFLADVVSELQNVSKLLLEHGNYQSMELIRRCREESLANYRREYERQHGVIEINSDGEDEVDHPIGVQLAN